MAHEKLNLQLNPGVELKATATPGIAHAIVLDSEKRFELTWDRFNRLYHSANAVKERLEKGARILDVGGFDGALALFLEEFAIDVIDPATTGGSGLEIPDVVYSAVTAIDALEHVEPEERANFVGQIANSTDGYCFINFPARRTASAQRLVYELTNNPLVREHVIWDLPCATEVSSQLQHHGFTVELRDHTSLAQWVSQYALQSIAADVSAKVNDYLVTEHLDAPPGVTLYDLIVGTRKRYSIIT